LTTSKRFDPTIKTHAELCRRLKVRFSDPDLLARALTHRSKSELNYERLEFLGDSVLSLVVSALLYDRFPNIPEGQLTRLRAVLVKKEALAALARELNLGEYLLLGGGELKSGGFDRDSILADSLEAVFGAVYVDGGIERARTVIGELYRESLERLNPDAILKDPKTELQEFLQKHAMPTPIYTIVKVSGESHNQRFVVSCQVSALAQPVEGEGATRRFAEQQAAATALRLLAHGKGPVAESNG
jgi:ribonuclease-3